jgi:hypothetical protein
MIEEISISVENKLITEERDIYVYRHLTKETHIISHGNSSSFDLGTTEEMDYLSISTVAGPGDLIFGCLINLPLWVDFQLNTEGKVTLTHSGSRVSVRVPPGTPTWQLKITLPTGCSITPQPGHDFIIVGDNELTIRKAEIKKGGER